jgi:tetratricopeptide (TPR) repeat protein
MFFFAQTRARRYDSEMGRLPVFGRYLVPALLVGALCLGGCGQAHAQAEAGAERSTKHPRPNNVDRSKDIEFLFGALKAAPDAESAKAVETRILALWQASGSDTADLLMGRVKQAVERKDLDLALQLLDGIVEIRPAFVEGWNRRATLNFLKKDFGAALEDLRQVLAREPRHFGALVGLGMILQELGEDKMALTALRRALEVHPHLPRVGEQVKALEEKVEGRAI